MQLCEHQRRANDGRTNSSTENIPSVSRDTWKEELHTWRREMGSMPVVGSSRKMMRGLAIKAMATDRRRFMPPEYVPARTPAAAVRLTCTP